MIKLRHAVGLVWFTFSCQATGEEFKWKTKSPAKNFKCLSQDKGGFLFQYNDNHKITRFTDNEEFYLTHISEIPNKFFSPKKVFSHYKGETINDNKEAFEMEFFDAVDFMDIPGFIKESGAFFIRKPNENPEKYMTYAFSSCEYRLGRDYSRKKEELIMCYVDNSSKTFKFNLGSGRFVYSYTGSWESSPQEYFAGESAIIAFGECKEYYN